MRLVDSLPTPWREWAEETSKLFIWHKLPDYSLKGNMDGFLKALLCGLVDSHGGPPPPPRPALTVAPPHMPLERPPQTSIGHHSRGRDKGELSRPPMAKKARTEIENLDSSEDEDEVEDKHVVEVRYVVENEDEARNEHAENAEEEEIPFEDEDEIGNEHAEDAEEEEDLSEDEG